MIYFFIQLFDYESRRFYILKVEVENIYVDFCFYYLGLFKDIIIVKIFLEDVDEFFVFSRFFYLFEVYEDIEVGIIIGIVMVRDLDFILSFIR